MKRIGRQGSCAPRRLRRIALLCRHAVGGQLLRAQTRLQRAEIKSLGEALRSTGGLARAGVGRTGAAPTRHLTGTSADGAPAAAETTFRAGICASSGDDRETTEWCRTAHPALQGKPPLEQVALAARDRQSVAIRDLRRSPRTDLRARRFAVRSDTMVISNVASFCRGAAMRQRCAKLRPRTAVHVAPASASVLDCGTAPIVSLSLSPAHSCFPPCSLASRPRRSAALRCLARAPLMYRRAARPRRCCAPAIVCRLHQRRDHERKRRPRFSSTPSTRSGSCAGAWPRAPRQ